MLAEILDNAERAVRAVPRLTDAYQLDVPAAYQVQRAGIELRVARGERVVGVKMGFTSRAKMAQMGIHDVIWGQLTDAMLVETVSTKAGIDLSALIQPKIEPEVAYLIGRPVRTPAEADTAVAAVAVGFDVLDSRYLDFSFTLPDVIADNASAARFGIGAWHAPCDLANRALVLEIDGQVAAAGSTAAILGDPVRSLRAAARLSLTAGIPLDAGSIVLAGAATPAVPLPRGAHIRVTAAGLGSVAVTTR